MVPLSIDTLKKLRDLKILIVATESGITLSGHSVLIISLPEIKGPEFEDSVYIVEYPKDGKGPIKFQNNLNFKEGVEVDSIDINGKSTRNKMTTYLFMIFCTSFSRNTDYRGVLN